MYFIVLSSAVALISIQNVQSSLSEKPRMLSPYMDQPQIASSREYLYLQGPLKLNSITGIHSDQLCLYSESMVRLEYEHD